MSKSENAFNTVQSFLRDKFSSKKSCFMIPMGLGWRYVAAQSREVFHREEVLVVARRIIHPEWYRYKIGVDYNVHLKILTSRDILRRPDLVAKHLIVDELHHMNTQSYDRIIQMAKTAETCLFRIPEYWPESNDIMKVLTDSGFEFFEINMSQVIDLVK